MGFKTSEIYSSGNTLKAADLQKKEWTLTIADITLAEIPDDGRVKKMLDLKFRETDKNLLLNKTNMSSIEYQYGGDTDGWLNKQIILYPTLVDFGGKQVEAIRIRIPMESATPQPTQEAAPENMPERMDPNEYEDSIPF